MPDYSTASYTIGDYNITGNTRSDVPNVIEFTTSHQRLMLCGFVNAECFRNYNETYDVKYHSETLSSLLHKITLAFVNDRCEIKERKYDWLVLTINLYDNTKLEVDMWRKNNSCVVC